MHIYSKFFKDNADLITLIFAIVTSSITSVVWMNEKFNGIDLRLVKLETVLIMQDIMPEKLAKAESQEKKIEK